MRPISNSSSEVEETFEENISLNITEIEEIIQDNLSNTDKIGDIISPAQLSQLRSKIEFLCDNSEQFRKQIQKIRNELVFNIGESGKFGAKQINLLLKEKNNTSH